MAYRSDSYLRLIHSDLLVVAILGLWTLATPLGDTQGSLAQLLLGLIAVLFAPGYALVAALYPGTQSTDGTFALGGSRDSGSVTAVERLVLAFGLSVCVVPLLGLGLHFTTWNIRQSTFLGIIGATTVALSILAAMRRFQLSPEERFAPRFLGHLRTSGISLRGLQRDSAMTLVVVAGLVISASGIGFAVMQAERGEQFTEFALLTEDPETGELVAGGYPNEISQGETESVQVEITNREGTTTNYTVVVLLQSFDGGDLSRSKQIDVFSERLQPGETVRNPHRPSPEMTGEDLRVTYLLYIGSPPENAGLGMDTAYRRVHFWVDVSSS